MTSTRGRWGRWGRWGSWYLLPLLPLLPLAVEAQSLGDRIRGLSDATARLQFMAREGVCGNGRSIYLNDRIISFSRNGMNISTTDWADPSVEMITTCDDSGSVVRMSLRVIDRRVTSVRMYVGGRWRPEPDAVDLGMVGGAQAADFLISLIAQSDVDGASQAILAASVAEGAEVWPRLLAVARDNSRSRKTRDAAIYWIGQAAGERVAPELRGIVDDPSGDRESRKQAVFALSQISRDRGVPLLIDIARTNRDPEIRRTALFWLGQSKDPRALDLFEEILRR